MRMKSNVASLTIALCLVVPASGRAQWSVLDSTTPPLEVGQLSQVGTHSFVLRQPLNETQLWLFEIDSNGFKQGLGGAYYQDDSCLGTPYLDVVGQSQLVIAGLIIGDQVFYATDVGRPMTFNSYKTLPGGSCQLFASTVTAAPMLTRPLSEINQGGNGASFVPPFVLRRH